MSLMETTLILLKPDCVTKNNVGEVIRRFESSGFKIKGCKMISLSSELLAEHYAHIASKPFFPEVAKFMQSSPVIALAIAGDNAVDRIRTLLGPTDSRKAEKGTIRGDLGSDMMVNVAHASDSSEAAAAEIKRFFKPEEIFCY
jgi:nucleoside-diphosphate kinase